jgi:hypothetical protein
MIGAWGEITFVPEVHAGSYAGDVGVAITAMHPTCTTYTDKHCELDVIYSEGRDEGQVANLKHEHCVESQTGDPFSRCKPRSAPSISRV